MLFTVILYQRLKKTKFLVLSPHKYLGKGEKNLVRNKSLGKESDEMKVKLKTNRVMIPKAVPDGRMKCLRKMVQ